jgi:hypothetical protein
MTPNTSPMQRAQIAAIAREPNGGQLPRAAAIAAMADARLLPDGPPKILARLRPALLDGRAHLYVWQDEAQALLNAVQEAEALLAIAALPTGAKAAASPKPAPSAEIARELRGLADRAFADGAALDGMDQRAKRALDGLGMALLEIVSRHADDPHRRRIQGLFGAMAPPLPVGVLRLDAVVTGRTPDGVYQVEARR